ncbi:hypothetical protein LWE61_08560 [Sphingobium sufflavum]|uniref:hypothetical protein n=1 Tax=Sphingobium sufflavum TaxID=1129547 RepID=UPI001F440BF1|nr:hypothetical protein [Sphingobium sufflavum]MCE7796609.1 hypothetical protein [Sphingobium sufflavum]
MMRHSGQIALMGATLGIAASAVVAAPSHGATIALTGIVPTRCEAQFSKAPEVVTPRRIDLGLLSRSCNDGAGYRIILHTPGSLKGAVFYLGSRRVPLSPSGVTVVVDSNRDEKVTEAAAIALDTPLAPGSFASRVETVPKGTIY